MLSFHVNGENQGPAASNVYSTDKHVYGFVDHYGQAVTSTITEGERGKGEESIVVFWCGGGGVRVGETFCIFSIQSVVSLPPSLS